MLVMRHLVVAGGGDRDGALTAADLRRQGLGRSGAELGAGDLLAGEDVDQGDPAGEIGGIGDRARLDVVLRVGGDLVELLRGYDRNIVLKNMADLVS